MSKNIVYNDMDRNSLDNLKVYQCAVDFSDLSWEIHNLIPKGYRYRIGSQYIESADSVGANLAEGYGRYSYKQRIHFCRYARGSLYECRFWFTQIEKRFSIDENTKLVYNKHLRNLGFLINQYIKYLKSQDTN